MATFQNVSVSNTSVTFKNKSINKIEILSIEYEKPKNIIWAIASNVLKYAMLIIFIVGIPIAIYYIYMDIKYCRVILNMRNHVKNSNRADSRPKYYVTAEEMQFLKENY